MFPNTMYSLLPIGRRLSTALSWPAVNESIVNRQTWTKCKKRLWAAHEQIVTSYLVFPACSELPRRTRLRFVVAAWVSDEFISCIRAPLMFLL